MLRFCAFLVECSVNMLRATFNSFSPVRSFSLLMLMIFQLSTFISRCETLIYNEILSPRVNVLCAIKGDVCVIANHYFILMEKQLINRLPCGVLLRVVH